LNIFSFGQRVKFSILNVWDDCGMSMVLPWDNPITIPGWSNLPPSWHPSGIILGHPAGWP